MLLSLVFITKKVTHTLFRRNRAMGDSPSLFLLPSNFSFAVLFFFLLFGLILDMFKLCDCICRIDDAGFFFFLPQGTNDFSVSVLACSFALSSLARFPLLTAISM